MTIQYRWPITLNPNTPLKITQGELICIACGRFGGRETIL